MTAPPPEIERVADLLAGFPGPWALCGGWAVDAWVGRTTRTHRDVDVAVFLDDQAALFRRLENLGPVGHDDAVEDESKEPWDGRTLFPPAHVHTRRDGDFEAEFHLVERDPGEWILRREPRVALPLVDAVRTSPWGVPAVAPAVILFYKALPPTWRGAPRSPPRPRDEADLRVLRPRASPAERAFVRDAVARVEPEHPWLALFGRAAGDAPPRGP